MKGKSFKTFLSFFLSLAMVFTMTNLGDFNLKSAEAQTYNNVSATVTGSDKGQLSISVTTQASLQTSPSALTTGGITTADIPAISVTSGSSVTVNVIPSNGNMLQANSLMFKADDPNATATTAIALSADGTTGIFTMPNYNVRVLATFVQSAFSIGVDPNITNGTILVNPTSASAGTAITVTATGNSGYTLRQGSLQYTNADGTGTPQQIPDPQNNSNVSTFIMPTPGKDITITAVFDPVPAGTHTVSINPNLLNGVVTVAPTSGTAGTPITVTLQPASGYTYKPRSLRYTKVSDSSIVLIQDPLAGSLTTSFDLPDDNVTINCTFIALADFLINAGKGYTNSKDVELSFTSSDYAEVQVINSDPTVVNPTIDSNTSRIPISGLSKINWSLDNSSGDGKKQVSVRFIPENATSYSDLPVVTKTVVLDTVKPVVKDIIFDKQFYNVNDFINVVAHSDEKDVSFSAEILDANGNIVKTIVLGYIGQNTSNPALFEFSAAMKLDEASYHTVRVQSKDLADNLSDPLTKQISYNQKSYVTGRLVKGSNGAYYHYVYLYRLLGGVENYFGYTQTDWNGNFSFNGVPSGNYRLKSSGDYYRYNDLNKDIIIQSNGNIGEFSFEPKYPVINSTVSVQRHDNTPIPAHIYLYNWNYGIYEYRYAPNGSAVFNDMPSDYGYYMYAYDSNYNWLGSMDNFKLESYIPYVLPESRTLSGTAYYLDENGTRLPMSNIYVSASTVYDPSNPYGYSYHGAGAYTDANGKYTMELRKDRTYSIYSYNWSGKYSDYPYSDVSSKQITMDTSKTMDVSFYKANKIFGKVLNSINAQPVTNTWLYAYSNKGYGSSVSADSKGEYSMNVSRGDITMYAYDWSWNYEYFTADKNSTPAVPSFSDTDSGVYKEYNVSLKPWGVSDAFKGAGNSVVTTQEVVQKGNKNIKVKVNYQNNSGETLTNVRIKAMLPEGVTLSNASNNTGEETIAVMNAGEKGSFNFMIDINESFMGDSITIPVNANFDNARVSNVGTAYFNVIYVKLSGNPVAEKDAMYTIYGEATPGTEITIYQKDETKPNKKGSVVGTGITNGKWYTIKYKAPDTDGEYVYFAESKYKEDRAISNDITVKVDSVTPFIKDVVLSSSGGTKSGINELTGVASYTAFVNGALEGRDISVEVEFGNAQSYSTATIYFAGKEYTAYKDSSGKFKANVTGWKGSGTKPMTIKLGSLTYTIAEVVILIDPSGYVFDAYTGKLLSDATAECFVLKDEATGEWVSWDAQKYGQVNPQITLDDGKYGWMVPEGTYRVVVQKNGYQTFDTLKTITGNSYNYRDLSVLPERLDINIGLVSTDLPVVVSTLPEDNGLLAETGTVKILFNKAVDPATLNAANVTVRDADGKLVQGTVAPIEQQVKFKAEHADIEETYAMGVSFKSNSILAVGRYSVVIENISDLPLREDSTKLGTSTTNSIFKSGFVFTVADDITYLSSPTFELNGRNDVPIDTQITVQFNENINKDSVNNSTFKLVSEKGAAVEGTLTVNNQEVKFQPSSALDYSTAYMLNVSEFIKSENKNTLAADYKATFTTVKAEVSETTPTPPPTGLVPTPPTTTPTPPPTQYPPYYPESPSSGSETTDTTGSPTVVKVKNDQPGKVDWGKIISTVKSAKANTIVEANMEKDTMLPVEILKAIKGKNLSIKLTMGDFTWVINGKDVEDLGNLTTIDMGVVRLNDKELSELTQKTDLLQIELKHNGAFPFAAKLYFALDKKLAGTKAYLLYYNENNVEYGGQALVNADGIVCFTFRHASKYVISDSILKSMKVEELVSTPFMVPYYLENGVPKLVKLSVPNGKSIEYIAPKTAVYDYKNNLKVFSDVYGHWASDSIYFVSSRELFYGISEKEFAPDTSMTRGMFVTVLGRLYGIDESDYSGKNIFSDVAENEWFTPYVAWASENKIVSGIGGGLFDPYAPVTNEQMSLIVMNYSNFINHSFAVTSSSDFTDTSQISPWAYNAVSTLNKAGVLGYAKDSFKPKDESTRAEISTVLHRMIQSIVSE